MIKKLIKHNIRYYSKVFLFIGAMLAFICSFGISTFAYSEDQNGNLVSDNLVNYSNVSETRNGVTYTIDNGVVTLNGTATGTIFIVANGTFETGTYTWAMFNSTTNYNSNLTPLDNNLRVELRTGVGSVSTSSQIYFDTINKTKTFTISSNMNSVYIRIASGTILNNFVFSPMLVSGTNVPSSFEPYGAIYYKNRYITDASVLDYTNISKGYINFNGLNNQPMQFGFIYNGRYGRYNDTTEDFEWNGFTYDTNDFIKDKINSSYGSFYHTEWNMYDMLTYYTTGYTSNDNVPLTLTYEFITPINLNNVGFDMAEFDYLSFYDSNGYLLSSVSRNDNQTLTYNNVGKIVGERHLNDIPEDILYIASSLSSGYYDLGYKAGYNNGYNQGTQDGRENAMDIGYQEGYRDGKTEGYDEGYNEALGEDITTRGFWGLLNSIMSYPVNMIKSVFNFEFMGINLSALITFIVSIVIVIFIVHRFKK